MPSMSPEQTQPSAEDDSRAQMVEAAQESSAVAEAERLPDAVPASEQKKRKKQRRKKQKLPPHHQRRMVQALGRKKDASYQSAAASSL